jgi:hypothetical protein
MLQIQPIRTDAGYKAALAAAGFGTPETKNSIGFISQNEFARCSMWPRRFMGRA